MKEYEPDAVFPESNIIEKATFDGIGFSCVYLDGEIKIKDAVYIFLHYSFSATQSAKNLISIVS